MIAHLQLIIALALQLCSVVSAQDNLGLSQGYVDFKTQNFDAQLVGQSQVLASLKPAGSDFDFLPSDYISRRARNGQYHWGDITIRYRVAGSTGWTQGDSSAARQPVTKISNYSANLAPTISTGPLNITRLWTEVDGDVALLFTLQIMGSSQIEVGSLGFPAEFNSIFTDRTATEMQALCSLSDSYIGMHAGHIRVAPTKGTGAALIVTPIGDTPLEAYRNLYETYHDDTAYGSQTFEGFYEWQVLTKAWAENECAGKDPRNPASSKTLNAGGTIRFGLRFSVALDGVRGLDEAIEQTNTPIARGVPGYVIPRDSVSRLLIKSNSSISSLAVSPAASLALTSDGEGTYLVTPSASAWGRARLTITYADARVQTIHYYITKSGTEAVGDLGSFAKTAQWFNNTSYHFGRATSVMTYDYEAKSIVTQESRVWIAGLSDEAGAGSFLAASMKQAIQPNADEVTKL
jgi:hypothetical protein